MRRWLVVPAAALALLLASCGGAGGNRGGATVVGDQQSGTPWGLNVARSTARWAGNGDIVANVDIDGGVTRLQFSLWRGDEQVWCCFDLKAQPNAGPRLLNFATTIALPHAVKATLDPRGGYRLGVEAYRQDAFLASLGADVTGPVPEVEANW